MNERIKKAREALGLTMKEFGSRIGLTTAAISRIESGVNSTTEQTILSICREFGVDEVWLRTGEGEMFSQDRKTVIDRVVAEYKLSESDRALLTAFLELNESDRAAILRYIKGVSEKLAPSAVPDSVAAGIAAQQDYAAMLAEEKEAADTSSSTAG